MAGSVGSSGWPPQTAAHGRIAPSGATEVPPQELTACGSSKVSSSLFSGILEKELYITSRLCSIKLSASKCPSVFQKLCKDLWAHWKVAW